MMILLPMRMTSRNRQSMKKQSVFVRSLSQQLLWIRNFVHVVFIIKKIFLYELISMLQLITMENRNSRFYSLKIDWRKKICENDS